MPEGHDTRPLEPVVPRPPGWDELSAEEQIVIDSTKGNQPAVNMYLMTKLAKVQQHSEGVVKNCRTICERNEKRFRLLERMAAVFGGMWLLLTAGWAALKFIFTGE